MVQIVEYLDTVLVGVAGNYEIYAHVGATSGELQGLFTRPVGKAHCVRMISFNELDHISNTIKMMVPNAEGN